MELPTSDNPVSVVEGDALEGMSRLPDASIDCILTDPPYFRTVREAWDNEWETAADFLAWLGRVADEWRRVLKPAGSLYCFASPRMAARVELMIAERFDVLNTITWHKDFPCGALKYGPENFRGYVEMSERVMFCQQQNPTGAVLRAARQAKNLRGTDMDVRLGYVRTKQPTRGTELFRRWEEGTATPSRDQWAAMSGVLDLPEYDAAVRPFSADMSRPYADVWVYKPVAQARLTHPCEKPVRMLRDMLITATRPGALVLDCFAGSGSLGEAVLKEDRRAVLIERDAGHAAIARRRVADAMGTGLLAGIA